jgi:hypothetical protein
VRKKEIKACEYIYKRFRSIKGNVEEEDTPKSGTVQQ